MLINYLRGDIDPSALMIQILVRAFVVFCTLPIHEFAHAWAAHKLGDDTARLKGRLTINPLAHLDLMGTVMIFLVGVGWAKPVPVNIRNFKNRKRDFALTALAGPISNLIMAFIFLVIVQLTTVFGDQSSVLTVAVDTFFFFAAYINIQLAVFNLLPIPPLDGSRLFSAILPDRVYYKIMEKERIIQIVLIALLFFGVFNVPLAWLAENVTKGMLWLVALPF